MPNRNKALGRRLEKKVAQMGDGHVQPLSGVLADFPNDVDLGRVLVECKVRSAALNARGEKHITIDLDWLKKVTANAKREGFDFGIVAVRAKGSRKVYALLDLDDLLPLLNVNLDTQTQQVVE